ncbi:uncharacterized protein N7496_008612 [Penicillium cataractarum]|uniref:Uncharacterized protein n=1 Tax=Penicillium cataractarum TaxID=2100454 RepID=A0A9W9RYY6_9EURO|nr:uncharacterized protein N7496_008612 [Penicillium cataractarum]KAJ5368852.1 hypothetical protein N7496_008612 [Penicillium cataractarum]
MCWAEKLGHRRSSTTIVYDGPESLAQGLQSTGHHEAQRKLEHDPALPLCLFLITVSSSKLLSDK